MNFGRNYFLIYSLILPPLLEKLFVGINLNLALCIQQHIFFQLLFE
jgi:hypothetical protein